MIKYLLYLIIFTSINSSLLAEESLGLKSIDREIIRLKNELSKNKPELIFEIQSLDSVIKEKGLKSYQSRISIIEAIYWKNHKNYGEAVSILLELEKKSSNSKVNLARVYRILGETYRSSYQYDESMKYLKKGELIAIKEQNNTALASIYNRMAAVQYEIMARGNDSIPYYINKSFEYIDKNDDLMVSNYNILGAYNRDNGNLEKAISFFKKGLEKSNYSYNTSRKVLLMLNMADTYIRKNKIEEGINIASQLVYIMEKTNPEFKDGYAYLLMANAFKDKGMFDSAFYYRDRATVINDSINRLSQLQMLIEAKTKNEVEKKDWIIENQKRNQIYIIIFFSIIFILALAFIYSMVRNGKKLREINLKYEESLAAKDKLFSIIGHDLKGPLGSIMNAAVVLKDNYDDFDDDDKKSIISTLNESSENLFKLLDNLLTWSRTQLKKIEVNKFDINLYHTVNGVLDSLFYLAEQKQVIIKNNIPQNNSIRADVNITETILRNIISNSIKYSETGKSIIIYSENINNEFIKILISDDGIGMDEKTLNTIFNVKKNKSKTGTNGELGTGLGLLICKEFVELQGGEIGVESKLNEGSTFWFTLPIY